MDADHPENGVLIPCRSTGYFDGQEILACEEAGVAVTLPKPMTSNAKAEGRFGKQDFAYLPDEDVYRCPSGPRAMCGSVRFIDAKSRTPQGV